MLFKYHITLCYQVNLLASLITKYHLRVKAISSTIAMVVTVVTAIIRATVNQLSSIMFISSLISSLQLVVTRPWVMLTKVLF